jgi:8-oxo-dGTP pyrophosphatase MutT (NUDIX family)
MSEPAPPRPSATVLILRDAPAGLEVFMVARERQVDFASGAVVFPGGKIDPDDQAPFWGGNAAGASPSMSPDRPYWIAAVRETFEEAGLLIARRADGAALSAGDAADLAARHRTPLLDGARSFSAICADAGLVPDFAAMVPFAHWITPVAVPKRFETHFFLVAAAADHHAEHDGREAVRSFWTRPRALIEDGDAGRQTLVPATRANLELLDQSRTVAEAMAAARTRKVLPVMPVMERIEGGMRLTIRQDAGYPTTEMILRRP